jgi:hypothetical protein
VAESHLTKGLFAKYAPADRRSVASSGIAETAGSREIDPKPKGDGGVFDKTGWEGPAVGGSHGHSLDPVPSPGPGKENDYALEFLDAYIVWCCWEPKRNFELDLKERTIANPVQVGGTTKA